MSVIAKPIVAVAAVLTALQCSGQSAREIHEQLLVLDTHLDTPARMEYADFNILERHSPLDESQVDLPRMREGGLDGGFWVIFTRQGALQPKTYAAARDSALLRAVRIREMLARHGQHFTAATDASDAARIAAAGRRVVYQSIENAYPLGEDLSLLETFYELGVRMISPVHSSNNQFADSSTDPRGQRWSGLSPLGRELVQEANRIGMIVDGSHAHDETLDQLIELSATPIVLSHSGPKAVYDHPRNVDDARLKALAAAGGVIQMNALGSYLIELPRNPELYAALAGLRARYPAARQQTSVEALRFNAERRELYERFPRAQADFEDYMAHFLHVLALVGPNHVGVGADWDGGGGVAGMEDVSQLPRITERLLAEGYTEADLAKIWGGNVLRVLAEVEAYAREQRSEASNAP